MPNVLLTFEDLQQGDIVNGQYSSQGVTISSTNAHNPPMIFDTDDPTGGDYDLETNNLGNVLILSEDGDSSDPDDNAGGGTFVFEFDEPSQVINFRALDIEEGGTVTLYAEDGSVIATVPMGTTSDGGQKTVQLTDPATGQGYEGVAKMEIEIYGSGAIDLVCYVTPESQSDGVVDGEASGEVMVLGYDDSNAPTDQGGDMITNGDDTIFGNGGDDYIEGAAGDDIIYGDDGGNGATSETVREVLSWEDANLDDGAEVGSFSINTGNVSVTVSTSRENSKLDIEYKDDETINVDGIDTGNLGPVNANSSIEFESNGSSEDGALTLEFDEEVENVSFRIADLDFDASFTVFAFDADGNPVDVNFVNIGSNIETPSNDPDGPNTVEDNNPNSGDPRTSDKNAVGVEIAGPVATIVLAYDAEGGDNSQTHISDIYYDVTTTEFDPGVPGDDTIVGGEGSDTMYGEDGDDTFIVSVASDGDGDVVIGGNGPDDTADNDTLDLRGTGQVTIVSSADASDDGALSGTVTFEDGSVLEFSQIETILTDPQNEAPTANDDLVEVDEDETVTFDPTINDVDPDGDPLTVVDITDPANGQLVDNGDGTFTYIPDPNFNGTDSVNYTVEDPSGEQSTATVTFDVAPVNDGPIANDDSDTTPEDTPITVDLIANDTDADGDTLTVIAASVPADQGTLVDNGDGTVTFTPAENFTGDAIISYEISDGNGGTANAQHVITVTPVNDGVDAVDDEARTPITAPVVIDVLANDSDPDGDPFELDSFTQPAAGGTVTENPDGTLTFTPDGTVDGEVTFTYTITDGDAFDTATVTILIRDGIVEGTAGDDLIDINYLGDPEGDLIDNGDAILPGEGPEDDIVLAGDGNDTVFAGEGDDEVYGEDGDDTLYGDAGNDYISGGEGNDVLYGGDGDDTLDAGQGGDELYGEDGNDTLLGGPGEDFISGGAGDDTITGGNSADEIVGGLGNDDINGEDGNDMIEGNNGEDFILGGLGNDTIDGGAGNDQIYGEDGDDLLFGGAGDDYLSGGNGDDVLYGGTGNDDLDAGQDGDTLFGEEGDDNLDGGAREDYLDGGEGDDTISGGNADDIIIGGDGSDTVFGDDGNDTIDTGRQTGIPLPDLGYPGLFPADSDPNDDIDFVDGGAGDDIISTGDDADTIFGGTGNDTIDGGIDADTIDGGEGDDRIVGGEGSDVIDGGAGNDIIYAGIDPDLGLPDNLDIADVDGDLVPNNGMDIVRGGEGNDTIFGADDDDQLFGDEGDDFIDGGVDDDLIDGGTGNDTLIGGQGADTIIGGDDRDTILVDNAEDALGDVVDGGTGGDDYDVLNLTGSGPLRIVNQTIDADGDSTSGTIEFLDGVGGNVIGTLEFSEIEEIVPCFTPGTSIATPRGEMLVEDLQVGDKIITRDNGIQEIRWIGAKRMDGRALQQNPHLQPVLIKQGSLGNGLPERDMLVSPNHRMLVNNDRVALYFEENEVLVSAKHLVNPAEGVQSIASMGTTYIHFMFDNHEVVLSNGAWTESFQPGDYSLKGIGNAQRNEIFELFPELQGEKGREAYASARLTLKKHEARMLFK